MKNIFRLLLPIIILGLSFLAYWQITQNPTKAKQQTQASETRLSVHVQPVQQTDFTPRIRSYGEVQAKVSGSLVAEVSGKLIYVSPKLLAGGQFQKGDKLAEIDPREYQAALIIAEGNLASATFKLEEEIALGQQAKTDWTRLGKAGEASSLALRKPHLIAAQAQLKAAQAVLEQAKLNVEKTIITAPYTGKVLTKYLSEGQYLSANTVLADIFASNTLEVRLPLSLLQYSLIAQVGVPTGQEKLPIKLSIQVGSMSVSWPAHIVSVENFLDPQSKQLHLIAEINLQEIANASHAIPLNIGQFVEAEIEARTMKQVFVIPRSALYQNETVYISEQNRLTKKTVKISWSDEKYAVIQEGLSIGDLLVMTPLGNPVSGTLLSIEQVKPVISQMKAD